MNNWEEVKTAYQVAISGSVAAAARELGVHRATVIRHIDSLESKLGQKLFIRRPHGYTPTATGKELMRAAKMTDDQFKATLGKIRRISAPIQGDLIAMSLDFLAPVLLPSLAEFFEEHPETNPRYVPSENLSLLQNREAHLALVGCMNQEVASENIIFRFRSYDVGLFASKRYVIQYGVPSSPEDFHEHRFLLRQTRVHTPFEKWMIDNVPTHRAFKLSAHPAILHRAVAQGLGIGFVPLYRKREFPHLIEVLPRNEDWTLPLWVVVPKDLYGTDKVNAFLAVLARNGLIGNKPDTFSDSIPRPTERALREHHSHGHSSGALTNS
ncbi:MAG: LysR family transcriptional regulator [Verrucomicrobiota bacterium]